MKLKSISSKLHARSSVIDGKYLNGKFVFAKNIRGSVSESTFISRLQETNITQYNINSGEKQKKKERFIV